MKRYEGIVTARQGGLVVDITAGTLTYDIEAWASDGTGRVQFSAATPTRPWRNVEVTAAKVGDLALVYLDDQRLTILCPTESVDFGDCETGGSTP